MLTKSWRRFRSPAAWTFAIVFGAPMFAEAQQSGLFPLAPIRRQRVPCPMEDPVYGLYRQDYFGYHPTCWRRFPAGWGCPSAEAPNLAAAFDPKQGGRLRDPAPPLSTEDDMGEPGPGMEGPAVPGVPGGGNALPPVPAGERSPFDLDNTKPGDAPADRPARRPATPPVPADNPLELPPPADPQGKPGDKPAAELPPTGRVDPTNPENAPLLALPEPAAPATPTFAPSPNSQPRPVAVPAPAAPAAYVPGTPAQAPRRTSMLGGLFGGLRRR